MTKKREFPTTTKAERAASTPGTRTVSALLQKVDPPNDYANEPEAAEENDSNYFAVSFNYGHGSPVQGIGTPKLGDRSTGANATRLTDAVPADPSASHLVVFRKKRKTQLDLLGWHGDFWLISDRLRRLIEELDPDSLECVEATGHNLTPDQPYWVCLSKRNLEAVDAIRSDIRITHKNIAADGEKPIIFQKVGIYRGAVFDPQVTKSAHHFWDIDLQRWFWSRELIARARHARIRGPRFTYAGRLFGGDVHYTQLDEIYAEFPKK